MNLLLLSIATWKTHLPDQIFICKDIIGDGFFQLDILEIVAMIYRM